MYDIDKQTICGIIIIVGFFVIFGFTISTWPVEALLLFGFIAGTEVNKIITRLRV